MENPKFEVGLMFTSKKQFKDAMDSYSIKWGKNHAFKKNDKTRLRAVCKVEKCHWFIHASKMQDSDNFLIKTFGPKHKYGMALSNKHVTSTFLSKRYLEYLSLNTNVSIGESQDKICIELNVNISRTQAYKTFRKAKTIIYGIIRPNTQDFRIIVQSF
ncbi:hypothetical protein ACH5RR_026338 [Cinchona calisaya]|uniref:Transposase MuDR plant domain-containing protein n=1 Tax=Cinchona calisaya TaxID=153742 RepID=A0ABD2Z296_9GENT